MPKSDWPNDDTLKAADGWLRPNSPQSQDELENIIGQFFIMKAASPDYPLDVIKRRNETGEPEVELKQLLLAWRRTTSLEARLVELDLFEQFLNRQTWNPKPLEDCYEYKMARLKDLEARLDLTKKNIGDLK